MTITLLVSILFVSFGKYSLGSKLVLVHNYDPNDFYTEIMVTPFPLCINYIKVKHKANVYF